MLSLLSVRAAFLGCVFLATPLSAAEYIWRHATDAAAFPPRDGAGTLTFNRAMWVIGGWHSVRYNDVWTSTDGVNWTKVTDSAGWGPRHSAGYVTFNGRMWVLGGDANSGHYQPDVWSSADGLTWSEATAEAPWGQRSSFYTVVHDGKIWLMGGQTEPDSVPGIPEQFFNDVWNSPDGQNWTRVTANAPWSPRGLIGGSVEFNGRMWIIGGGTYSTPDHPTRIYYNDVWSSADGVAWRLEVAHAPWCPREYQSVAVFDNRMWILTGWNGGNMGDIWYSSDGVSWTQVTDVPGPRHATGVAVYDDGLWVVAGSHPDPANDVWKLERVAPACGDTLIKRPAVVAQSCGMSEIAVSWSPASWAAKSSSGTYSVYRSIAPVLSDGCSEPPTLLATNLTSTSFIDATAVPGMTYFYFVSASSNCPDGERTTTSGASDPIVDPAAMATPEATLTDTNATICAGAATTLSVTLTGRPPWNLTWSDGLTQTNIVSNVVSRVVAPATTTVYTIYSVNDATCTGASRGRATINVRGQCRRRAASH